MRFGIILNIRKIELYHMENRYLLHSISSSLLYTSPYKINSTLFNYLLENITSSISSCASSKIYTEPNPIASPLNLFEALVGRATSFIYFDFTLVKITVLNVTIVFPLFYFP